MCLILSGIFSYLAYSFLRDGELLSGGLNLVAAVIFIILLIRNILQTKRYKNEQRLDINQKGDL